MKARIINNIDFGGFYTDDFLDNFSNKEINGQLVSEWILTENLPNKELNTPIWNGTEWVEGLTTEEIRELKVPKTITRLRFILQTKISTGIEFDDILNFIKNSNQLTSDQKYFIITKLNEATFFERNSSEFNMIADLMEVSNEKKDEIFINGNAMIL